MSQLRVAEIHHPNDDSGGIEIDNNDNVNIANLQSVNGGPLAGFRNQIINGDFSVWQRGTNFGAAAGNVFTADRWCTGGIANTAVQRVNFNNALDSFGISFSNATASGIFTPIELPAAGLRGPFILNSTWTLSWYELTAQLGSPVTVTAQFSDNSQGLNFVNNTVSAIQSGEVVGNFTRRSCTITFDGAIAATNLCLLIGLRLAAVNVAKQIFQVQLEPGPVATPFEHRPVGTELALCERYCHVWRAVQANDAFCDSAVWQANTRSVLGNYTFPTTMRDRPNMELNSAANMIFSANSSDFTLSTFQLNRRTVNNAQIFSGHDSGNYPVNGTAGFYRDSGTQALRAVVTFEAEL